MLAEDTDDLVEDEFDASMFKDDDLKDDALQKRGKKGKENEFFSEFTASNTTINTRIVGWNRTCYVPCKIMH